ncbi:MAG TPA: hypothetical protein VHB98_21695 [Chloroflexota bacterium]|nr:hypothetical protein [Chloroflexota bacterium]
MIEPVPDLSIDLRVSALRTAIRRTVAYADIFDYPLTLDELHRYLHGERATPAELRALVEQGVPGLAARDGLYALTGRLSTIAERRRREAASDPLAERARLYARLLKYLPFVRMLGLTGSLAMRNAGGKEDIDLMVVTAPGRAWLGRAAVVAVVRLARLRGDTLCPNYVLAENALVLDDTSIYAAHELAHMVPLYGRDVYRRLWSSNPWVMAQLPNAGPWHMPQDRQLPPGRTLKRTAERLLGGVTGDRLEAYERRRKTDRLYRRQGFRSSEIVLSPDQCNGHFGRHRARVLAAYHERLARMIGKARPMDDDACGR